MGTSSLGKRSWTNGTFSRLTSEECLAERESRPDLRNVQDALVFGAGGVTEGP